MAEIELKFHPDMAAQAKAGVKDHTTRSSLHGSPGDIFFINGDKFILLYTFQAPLEYVRDYLYRHEGFFSPVDFEGFWRKIHRGKFSKDRYYWVHVFRMVVT